MCDCIKGLYDSDRLLERRGLLLKLLNRQLDTSNNRDKIPAYCRCRIGRIYRNSE